MQCTWASTSPGTPSSRQNAATSSSVGGPVTMWAPYVRHALAAIANRPDAHSLRPAHPAAGRHTSVAVPGRFLAHLRVVLGHVAPGAVDVAGGKIHATA